MFRCGVAIAGLASLVWLSCNAQQDHHAFSSKGTSKSFNIRQLCRNVAGGRGVKVQDSPRGDDDRGLLLGFFGWLYLVSEQNFSRQCCSSMLFIHSCRAEKSIFFVYTAASHNMAGYSKWHAKLGCCFATGSRDSKPPAGVSGGAASLKDLHS